MREWKTLQKSSKSIYLFLYIYKSWTYETQVEESRLYIIINEYKFKLVTPYKII